MWAACRPLALFGPLFIVGSYTQFATSNNVMLVLGFPLGFCSAGVFSGLGPFFTELFPTSVRGSGQGFSYNVGRAIGTFFPALVGQLAASMTLGHAIGTFAVSAYGLLVLAAYCLPETKGKELSDEIREVTARQDEVAELSPQTWPPRRCPAISREFACWFTSQLVLGRRGNDSEQAERAM